MARKGNRYRGKQCPYCGNPESTTTRDHLIARSFLLKELRGEGIQLPACEPCNNQKAELESYATAIIPLNRRAHPDSQREAKRKLLNNKAYLRSVMSTLTPSFEITDGGIIVPVSAFTIDAQAIDDLYRFIAAGLFYHNTETCVNWDTHCAVVTTAVPGEDENLVEAMGHPNKVTYSGIMSNNSFQYEGVVFNDDPLHSMWRMNIHGLRTAMRGGRPTHFFTYVEFAPRWIVMALPPAEGTQQRIFDHPEICRYKPLKPDSLVYRRRQRWIDAGYGEHPTDSEINSALEHGKKMSREILEEGRLSLLSRKST